MALSALRLIDLSQPRNRPPAPCGVIGVVPSRLTEGEYRSIRVTPRRWPRVLGGALSRDAELRVEVGIDGFRASRGLRRTWSQRQTRGGIVFVHGAPHRRRRVLPVPRCAA
jgi:hypothetical protein